MGIIEGAQKWHNHQFPRRNELMHDPMVKEKEERGAMASVPAGATLEVDCSCARVSYFGSRTALNAEESLSNYQFMWSFVGVNLLSMT